MIPINKDVTENELITTVDILGTEYKVYLSDNSFNPKLTDTNGYIELWAKEIYVQAFEDTEQTINNLQQFVNKVLRHEIIHGYFQESGLIKYCGDEELVDALAVLIPKISKTFKNLEINQ